ncbi:MAG: hypothetical protein ACR2NR_10935 [Solirubrobacteraceae bacterium]
MGRLRGPGRARRLLGGSRDLARIVYRDSEHVPERLTLMTIERFSQASLDWAQAARAARPELEPGVIAEELRSRSATASRIDGAIAGTPFFVALVPGYLAYLGQEAIMVLRTAALYGRDPRELGAAAEMLALRGVYPTPEAARVALDTVLAKSLPEKPPRRRRLRNWVHSVRMVLVFGGFLSPPAQRSPTGWSAKLLAVLGVLLAIIVFVVTWVIPVTFIVAMAWGCESHTRELGRRAQAFYGGAAVTTKWAIAAAGSQRDQGHHRRHLIRSTALLVSVAVPVAFVAYADHVRSQIGINAVGAAGALVALSLVIATTVAATRR